MREATTLVEQTADWRTGAHVERSARLVRNVALAGPASKNGYRYSEAALRDGVALYDRKPVFLDHASDSKRPQERSTRDLVGSVILPRFEGDRIRGDIQVLDTEAGHTFLSLVESDAPGVGMSHVVLAVRSSDGMTVERIHDVLSVDAVIGPATTTTFRESIDAASPEGDVDVAQIELATVLRERDELAARVAVLERRQSEESSRTELQQLLNSSGLPDYAATPLFVQQLSTADERQRRMLIAERRELIARTSLLRPQSAERRDAGGSVNSQFVAAIRGRR